MSCLLSTSYSRVALYLAIFAAALCLTLPLTAQTFTVIHNFTGGADGAAPRAGLTIDARGSLYGTTSSGGSARNGECQNDQCGVVFQAAQRGSGWVLTPLYEFLGPGDGALPIARPVFGPNGLLYGTTNAGGENFCEGPGCGTAYGLRPGAHACTTAVCYWQEALLYSFGGILAICEGGETPSNQPARLGQHAPQPVLGSCPGSGHLSFDQAGNIYGTIPCCYGSVYQLTPSGNATPLYYFSGGNDGNGPVSGVIFDHAGNLYGTTASGGADDCGTVYELSPNGSGWTEKVLYSFQCGSDGQEPIGGLIFDAAGDLYGTTSTGGQNGGGTVFELTPSGSNWIFNLLYSLSCSGDCSMAGPSGSLAMDSSGSLYGTAPFDGAFNYGSVFRLTPSDGQWTYTSLHDFTFGDDGANPYGNVAFDAAGNLYGTAEYGGANRCLGNGCGVVWKITP
jgi:uncharacterized repeat protein (TIGR03803 family)